MAIGNSRPALLVGLTGGIGSGKTTVADLFGSLGVPLIDADLIAHGLTGPDGGAMPAIRDAFGARVIAADGRLDRDVMRTLAFEDPSCRQRLESILHPLIRRATQARIEAVADEPYAIVVVPLLVEGGERGRRFDRILVVDCPVELQIARVMRRNGLPRAQIEAIVAVQATRERRLAQADDILDNSANDPSELPRRVAGLHRTYLEIARAGQPQ